MPRGKSAYNQFVSSRMRQRSPRGLAESRSAMRAIAAEWRAMKGGRSNPRNAGGPSLVTLALLGGAGYWAYTQYKKGAFGGAVSPPKPATS